MCETKLLQGVPEFSHKFLTQISRLFSDLRFNKIFLKVHFMIRHQEYFKFKLLCVISQTIIDALKKFLFGHLVKNLNNPQVLLQEKSCTVQSESSRALLILSDCSYKRTCLEAMFISMPNLLQRPSQPYTVRKFIC